MRPRRSPGTRAAIGTVVLLAVSVGTAGAGCGPVVSGAPPTLQELRDEARRGARRGDPRALREVAWLELLTGDRGAGGAAFERALSRLPDDAVALLGAATLLADNGDHGAARRVWLRLLQRTAHDQAEPAAGQGMAEVAAARLAEGAREAPGRLALVQALAALPDHRLSPGARRLLRRLRASLLRQRGQEQEANRLERAMGCVPAWGVVGPYGHRPHLDLARQLPPEGADWRKPSAPDLELREVPGRRCRVLAESQTGRPGVLFAVAYVTLPAPAEVVVTVESETDLMLQIGGQEVLRRYDARRFVPRQVSARLDLAAGTHRLLLKLAAIGVQAEARVFVTAASGDAVPGARFAVRRPRGPLAAAPARVEAVVIGSDEAPAEDDAAAMRPVQTSALVQRYVDAYRAYLAGDAERAQLLVEELLRRAPAFAAAQLLAARVALADPSRPHPLAPARARAALAEAARRHHPGAVFELALLDQQDEQPRVALERLDEARRLVPSRARIDEVRSQLLKARGWDRESELALEDAARKNPDSCRILGARGEVLVERHDVPGVHDLLRELRQCDVESEYPADGYRDTGRLPESIVEYRRLLALDPQREEIRSGLAEALMRQGAGREAVAELQRLVRLYPRRASYHVRLADAWLAVGEAKRAREALEQGRRQMPAAAEIDQALETLEVKGLLEPWRIDGRRVIAEYEAAAPTYTDPAVYVLDRTVSRVLPGGSHLTLTHNIVKIVTKEGVDRHGEVELPQGADILNLRTVKQDGTTREPEGLAGKRSVSAPDLAVGDYLELEYLVRHEASTVFHRGFVGERFYFRSYDAPLFRTEYLLVTPPGMPIMVDARGGAPAATRRTVAGLAERTWARRDMARAVAEPRSPPPIETLPSVRVGVRAALRSFRDAVRERLFGAERANRELRHQARELCANVTSQRACAQAIYELVASTIEPGAELAATATLARRRGNRLVLCAAMLEAAGLRVEKWLVKARTRGADPPSGGPTPLESQDFADWVVRVAVDGKTLFLDPRARRTPFAYVAPGLRGGAALPLTAGPARLVRVPRTGVGVDERVVDVDIVLRPDGSAQVKTRERLTGVPAQEWRQALDATPDDRLDKSFEERWLGYFFPGATLQGLVVEGRKSAHLPLVLQYRFSVSRLARREGNKLLVPVGLFANELQKRYVGVAQRRNTLVVLEHPQTTVRVRVRLPDGSRAARPEEVAVRGPFGRFTLKAALKAGLLELEKRTAVPFSRVPRRAYPAFVRFASAVDEAEARVIPITLR